MILAFAFASEQPTTFPDPKGGVHGCTPFSDRARDGESENPLYFSDRGIAVSGKALLFGYFLLGQQEKVTRPRQRTEALAVASKQETQRQEQSPWIPACAGMTTRVTRPRQRTEALALASKQETQRQEQSPWIPACAGMTTRVTRPRQRTEALAFASKQETQRQEQSPWIPACAGMTVRVTRPRQRTEALALASKQETAGAKSLDSRLRGNDDKGDPAATAGGSFGCCFRARNTTAGAKSLDPRLRGDDGRIWGRSDDAVLALPLRYALTPTHTPAQAHSARALSGGKGALAGLRLRWLM